MVSLGIFSVVPPTEPCALRSTQPLKLSTRDFSWGKGGRCVWLTTYHPCSAETSRKSGVLTYPESLRPPRPVAGHLYFLQSFIAWTINKPHLERQACSLVSEIYGTCVELYSVNDQHFKHKTTLLSQYVTHS